MLPLEISSCLRKGPESGRQQTFTTDVFASPLQCKKRAEPKGQDGQAIKAAAIFPNLKPSLGSFYHKTYSKLGAWTGIEGTVTLGTPVEDASRTGESHDGFSIYFGASRGPKTEVEGGFTWDRTAKEEAPTTAKAWRPFWRDTKWHNAPLDKRYFWQPGDKVSIKLFIAAPDTLRLSIKDLNKTPAKAFQTDFTVKGYKSGGELFFKRLTAIDEHGREGKRVVPTKAYLQGTIWASTYLRSTSERVPLGEFNSARQDFPAGHTRVTPIAGSPGGEKVDICGCR